MRYALAMVALVMVLCPLDGAAQESRPAGVWDLDELGGFVDGVMDGQQKAEHFAGAVAVVVRDGQVVFQKGYGYADFAERKPVDPQRTLFRIASNSKMFVWTAVMQLVEKGKLDLHTDVNRYLKGFQIPATFPQAITLEHLMTHTAGFEDRVIGLFAESPDKMRPLAELMRTQMPRRVFPPGQDAAYSNYGTTLAALIVEQVSGVPYERYLEENILRPLGMRHATLAQPVPKDLAGDLSKGYKWTAGRLKEQRFEFVPWAPCGGMSVSGVDMARFMMAQLNDGALGDARILRPETARLMRAQLSFPSSLPKMLHGFLPLDWDGQEIYGHGGDTIWFHSLTAMMPEQNLGFFVAINTDSGVQARNEFAHVFVEHYFPRPLPKEPPPPKDKRASLQRFAGTYFPDRSPFDEAALLSRLILGVTLSVDSDGYLSGNFGGEPFRFRQIQPLLFQEVDGRRRIVFRQNDRSEITDFCPAPLCVNTMQKQPWWQNPKLQWSTLGVALALLLGGLIGMPIATVFQRKQPKPRLSSVTRAAAWITCLVWLAGFGTLVASFEDLQNIVFGPTKELRLILDLWAAAALLTLVLLFLVVLAWRRSWWHRAGRISLTLVLIGGLTCILWLNHWNLLGWKY
jgi:CubicO group peptidase (beta-lactamase class C family)